MTNDLAAIIEELDDKDRRRKARIISDPAITPGAVADTMQERRELLRGWSGL